MAGNPRLRLSDEEQEAVRQVRLKRMAESARKRQETLAKRKPSSKGLDLSGGEEVGLDISWGHKEVEAPYKLEGSRVGIVSDIHVPSHDKVAFEAALRYLKSQNIDTLVINGDYMDMYAISAHDKDKLRQITFGDELEEGRLILKQIRAYFGNDVHIVYQEGNHEERYQRFLPMAMAGDKVRGATLREQLELDSLNITWVGDRRGIDLGKLRIYHGHEIKASGVNPTRAMIMKTMHNTIVGHLHRENSLIKPKLDGEYVGAWVTGCLCDTTPFYAVVNEWTHGFALVTVDVNGTFAVHQHRIINGKVL